jgi:hypothetical protein
LEGEPVKGGMSAEQTLAWDDPADNGDLFARTPAEATLLRYVRQVRVEKITVQLKGAKILKIDVEENIPPEDLDDGRERLRVTRQSDFETITVSRHDGKIVKAKRTKPIPFTDRENNQRLLNDDRRFFTQKGADRRKG